ncbi:hypothetical protein DH2020_046757 [Rehmannia glutinosa]|uniref:USP domain-containing protein n=1 Tax=Rehmannia glutinosa TaxID=99300 RepID=A0ABR0UAE3_REHGL
MDSPSPYDLSPCSDESSPESNDEALFLEDESGTEGTEDDDKLINSENTESNSLESQSLKPVRNWPGQTSMGVVPRPPFSTWLSRHNKPAEDAHEFLQCFLDKLESCHDSSQSHNIVKQVFGGRLVSQLKCCNCGHCSDTYEPSIDLSLEIEDADNLLTALQSFTKVEEIEDPETKFTCENCKEQVSVEKQLLLDQAPSVAVFHLKRFKSDGYFVQKLDKHVAFPLDLDLLPFTGNSKKNDVELVHEDFVLSQQAYILFYAKEGTYWFSSFIESQIFSVHPTIWNTSPKSVLDRVETSPVSSSLQNKIDNDCTEASHDVGSEHRQVEIKDSGRKQDKFEINESRDNLHRMSALVAPPCPSVYSPEVPSHEAHKEVSPTLREKVNRSLEKACVAANSQIDTPQEEPLRSPSPEIYREDPPDAGFSIPRNHLRTVDSIACKRRLDKDMDDLETRQAFSFVKKNMPGSRGQQMLDALRRSKTEASVNRKKGRKSGQDDSSIRPVLRPLVAGTHR